jgi:hypothetical protein
LKKPKKKIKKTYIEGPCPHIFTKGKHIGKPCGRPDCTIHGVKVEEDKVEVVEVSEVAKVEADDEVEILKVKKTKKSEKIEKK